MSVVERASERIKGRGLRVVFPEWEDPRVVQAVAVLGARDLCVPVPLPDVSDAMVTDLAGRRGIAPALAARMLKKPLIRAASSLAIGDVQAMVAGADSPTRRVIEAAGLAVGLAPDVKTPSSFFVMRFRDGTEIIFADCAVNTEPDAGVLADIARASARSCAALLGPARVALLSYSTGDSGTGPSVDQVRAAALTTGFTGPVQADAALNPVIAGKKGLQAGDANVLVFPSLDAGNIAYKLCQELAGAQAIGPVLQGFAKPVCDLSRGASVDDIVASTVLTLALAP